MNHYIISYAIMSLSCDFLVSFMGSGPSNSMSWRTNWVPEMAGSMEGMVSW